MTSTPPQALYDATEFDDEITLEMERKGLSHFDDETTETDLDEIKGFFDLRTQIMEAISQNPEWFRDYLKDDLQKSNVSHLPPAEIYALIEREIDITRVRIILADFRAFQGKDS